ncbi:unnamed protein product, partial [Adineta steineri]
MIHHLSPLVEQLKLKSKSILSDWQEYNRNLLQIEIFLREAKAEAEIDRVEISVVNVETYEMSTRKVQDFQQRIQQLNNEITKLHEYSLKLNKHLPSIAAQQKKNTQYSVINNQYSE